MRKHVVMLYANEKDSDQPCSLISALVIIVPNLCNATTFYIQNFKLLASNRIEPDLFEKFLKFS